MLCHNDELNPRFGINVCPDMILQRKEALPKRAKTIALTSGTS